LRGQITRRQFIVRSLAVGASLSSITAFLAACGQPAAETPSAGTPQAGNTPASGQPSEPQHLVIAGAKEVLGLDPHQRNDSDSVYVYELIHDTVAMMNPDGSLSPHLAESWEASEDGLTYTYRFRKGVKFHDGSELTADDVVFTIARILENKYPEGRKQEKIGMIDSYKKIDEYTVEITLQYAYAPFEAAFGIMHILPKAAVEKMGDDAYNRAPVGCGPFKFVEWVPKDHVTLEAFADYWLVKPKLEKITVRPIPENAVAVANLLSRDVDVIGDIVGSNLPQLRAASDKGVQILSEPGNTYFYTAFRVLTPPFTDLRFRQAVYMATDFDAAVKAIFPPEIAQRAYGPVVPGVWPQDEEYLKSIALKQDKTRARELFDELIREGLMAEDEVITFTPAPSDDRIAIAEVMVTDLKDIGINAELLLLDWAAHAEICQGDKNLIYNLGTSAAILDPDANLRGLFSVESSCGRELNIKIHPQVNEWEALLEQGRRSQDRQEREGIYRQLARTMMEQVIHIPMYHKNKLMAKYDYVRELDIVSPMSWDIVRPWANVYIEGKK